MASSTKTARFLVLALLVVSAVIMPSSVCHGIRGVGLGSGGALDPNHPACIGPCPGRGQPYTPRPGGGPGVYYPSTPAAQSNGENLHP
ncbi:hypothetical protein SEVIR_4G240000v4 [Setaria viridis]|uniref:Uncharacterized protein n=2 Tax=Setaria TaxID=4554 RepID=K3Y0E7_SETIT|nr:hypothetical protein SETIT_4G228600v2 [Setaria italica]TKW22614.1 hypothetical protein SEVIR_4G240000v2 [Setaria viridis]